MGSLSTSLVSLFFFFFSLVIIVSLFYCSRVLSFQFFFDRQLLSVTMVERLDFGSINFFFTREERWKARLPSMTTEIADPTDSGRHRSFTGFNRPPRNKRGEHIVQNIFYAILFDLHA